MKIWYVILAILLFLLFLFILSLGFSPMSALMITAAIGVIAVAISLSTK